MFTTLRSKVIRQKVPSLGVLTITAMHPRLMLGLLIGLAAFAVLLVSGSDSARALGPNAMRAGFDATALPANDDGSTGLVPIGFTIDFFGTDYTELYVNNNGNVTFDFALFTFTPFDLLTTGQVIIAPFFADVDTRVGNLMSYGPGMVDGRPAFGVTWPGVGCYNRIQFGANESNHFQLILIDRSDIAAKDFDIEFNIDRILWETGQASGGDGDCLGGNAARAGFSNGSTDSFELPGSGIPGAFLDSNGPTGLVNNNLNSAQLGRYLFEVRGGAPLVPEIINGEITLVGATPSFAAGPAFHLDATWTNTGTESFSDVFFDVTILEGAACACEMIDGGGAGLGGVGTDIPLDLGPDGIWSPGEQVNHTFWVSLTSQARLTFFGDVWGTPAAP